MFPAKKTQAKIAHKFVSNTLFGSAKIWWNRCRNIKNNEEEENVEEDEAMEEEEEDTLMEEQDNLDRPFY